MHDAFLAVYHDILEFSARVLVTDGIEVLNGPIGPANSSPPAEFTSTWGRSLALTARGRTLNGSTLVPIHSDQLLIEIISSHIGQVCARLASTGELLGQDADGERYTTICAAWRRILLRQIHRLSDARTAAVTSIFVSAQYFDATGDWIRTSDLLTPSYRVPAK